MPPHFMQSIPFLLNYTLTPEAHKHAPLHTQRGILSLIAFQNFLPLDARLVCIAHYRLV